MLSRSLARRNMGLHQVGWGQLLGCNFTKISENKSFPSGRLLTYRGRVIRVKCIRHDQIFFLSFFSFLLWRHT